MNTRFPRCRALLLFATGALAAASAFALRNGQTLDARATASAVTSLTTRILETSQYAHHALDQGLADRFLDRYINALDEAHLLFTQADVEEFGKFRPLLAQSLRRDGDNEPARAIFKRYLERLAQRDAWISATLPTMEFDFTGDDHYSWDRKEAPRPADLAAAQEVWRQQLRYDYLEEKIADKKPAEIVATLTRRSARTLDTMKKLNEDSVLEIYLEALAHDYDPHSDYMGHESMQSFQMVMNLKLAGIGAALRPEDGYCKIQELIPGGPAAKSGLLKVGDRLVGVAQGDTQEWTDLIDLPLSQAVELIRGPKGTRVRLSIIPAGADTSAERKSITIVRDEVKLEDQQAKARVVDLPGPNGPQRVGVIDLPGFYAGDGDRKSGRASATADVKRLLKKLVAEKVTGLVLDLRRNGGGSLDEAISLTGLFIPGGPVVQTRDMQGKTEVSRAPASLQMYEGPLVVLISRYSASASEILAGALQDYGRAVVVGDTSTFGKGTVQTMLPLDRLMQQDGLQPNEDPGALKVTIAKFYRPSGQSTQLRGVLSDVVLPSPSDNPETGEAELPNPLPWDTIPAAKFTPGNLVTPHVAMLKRLSAARIGGNPAFTELQQEIERTRKNRDSKMVSLNEAGRRKDKAEAADRVKAAKARREENKATPPPTWEITLQTVDKPGLGEPMKPKAAPAPAEGAETPPAAETDEPSVTDALLLGEAEHILSDYIRLLQAEPPLVTRR